MTGQKSTKQPSPPPTEEELFISHDARHIAKQLNSSLFALAVSIVCACGFGSCAIGQAISTQNDALSRISHQIYRIAEKDLTPAKGTDITDYKFVCDKSDAYLSDRWECYWRLRQ